MPGGDTPPVAPCPDATPCRAPVAPDRATLDALDCALFTSPFVLINASNRSTKRSADTAAKAHEILAQDHRAAAIVGTLIAGMWAVDVDPVGADAALVGEATSDLLVAWANAHDLVWLLRESGRPGGHHIIIQIPDHLLDALRGRTSELAHQLGVKLEVRKALRLLSSPHRLGLPCPIIDGTLTVHHLHPHDPPSPTVNQPSRSQAAAGTDTRTVVAGATDRDDSLSAQEYSRAHACARHGYTAEQAWPQAIACQVVNRGHQEWRRFIWSKVITFHAAETHADEDQAWARLP